MADLYSVSIPIRWAALEKGGVSHLCQWVFFIVLVESTSGLLYVGAPPITGKS